MSEAAHEPGERVVLGRRKDTFAGFSWTGAEPDNVQDPEEAEKMGAVWEGDEPVTYDLPSLEGQAELLDAEFLPDND